MAKKPTPMSSIEAQSPAALPVSEVPSPPTCIVTRSDLPDQELRGTFDSDAEAWGAFIKKHGPGAAGSTYTVTPLPPMPG